MGGLSDISPAGEYGLELEGGWEDLRGMSPLGREGVTGRDEGGGAAALGWESATWERCDWRGAGSVGRRGMSDKVDIQYTSSGGDEKCVCSLGIPRRPGEWAGWVAGKDDGV